MGPPPQPLGASSSTWSATSAPHKNQLFYYLKLQGLPVRTGHLYGM